MFTNIGRGRGGIPLTQVEVPIPLFKFCKSSLISCLFSFILGLCMNAWVMETPRPSVPSPFSAFAPLMRYLLYQIFIGICPTVLSDEASACPAGFPRLLNQPLPVGHEHNTTHPFIICDALLIQYMNWSQFLNNQNEDGYQLRLLLLSKCAVGSRVA